MKPLALIKDDFENLLDYQHWLKNAWASLSELNKGHLSSYTKSRIDLTIRGDSTWFGDNVSFEALQAGITEYQNPALLDTLYDMVNHEIKPEVRDRLKARKLRFNSLGFGMFCFDRAAMTMYRNEEFFSPSLDSKIDPRDVSKNPAGYSLQSDNSPVIKRWEEKPDGSPKVRTNTKELFAYFPEVARDRHAVEFFISCDAPASYTAEEMLYGGVAAVVMAELLVKAGIKVKINVVIGSALTSGRNTYIGCIVPIKQYNETLDRNCIALLSSDPRFMRFDGFKGAITAFDFFDEVMPGGLGYAMNAMQLKTLLENSGYTKKSKAAHRYYFGGCTDIGSALRDINRTIFDIGNKLT